MSDNITIRTNSQSHTINCVVVRDESCYRARRCYRVRLYEHKASSNSECGNRLQRRLSELKPQAKFDCNAATTIYIKEAGLRSLVIKSQLPTASDLATQLGISVETRYVRKETEIVGFVQDVLTQMMVPFEFQKNVSNFRIDLYLTEPKVGNRN